MSEMSELRAQGTELDELLSVEGCARVAAMEEVERRLVLRELIAAEYGGDADTTRRLAARRLRAWATIARSDLEGARRLGSSFDALFAEQPAEVAMRRAMVVQSVVGAEFDDEDRALLLEVVPGMRRHVVEHRPAVVTRAAEPAGSPLAGSGGGRPRRGLGRLFRRWSAA